MKVRVLCFFMNLSFLFALVLLVSPVASHGEHMNLQGHSGKYLATIAKGGLLYDKWYGVNNSDPSKETHPAYAKSMGKRKGTGTWRCKECHGWDYMGKDGAYKKGSHFSGIVGIRASAGGSAGAVAKSLRSDVHGLGKYLSLADIDALAAFVTEGQLDMDHYIDRGSKRAKGDLRKGERMYLTVCANCHGTDGKEINFKDEKKPEYLGTVAQGNPWETLHKIRMGQPGEEMPAMLAFPIQMQVDILAWTQQLPAK